MTTPIPFPENLSKLGFTPTIFYSYHEGMQNYFKFLANHIHCILYKDLVCNRISENNFVAQSEAGMYEAYMEHRISMNIIPDEFMVLPTEKRNEILNKETDTNSKTSAATYSFTAYLFYGEKDETFTQYCERVHSYTKIKTLAEASENAPAEQQVSDKSNSSTTQEPFNGHIAMMPYPQFEKTILNFKLTKENWPWKNFSFDEFEAQPQEMKIYLDFLTWVSFNLPEEERPAVCGRMNSFIHSIDLEQFQVEAKHLFSFINTKLCRLYQGSVINFMCLPVYLRALLIAVPDAIYNQPIPKITSVPPDGGFGSIPNITATIFGIHYYPLVDSLSPPITDFQDLYYYLYPEQRMNRQSPTHFPLFNQMQTNEQIQTFFNGQPPAGFNKSGPTPRGGFSMPYGVPRSFSRGAETNYGGFVAPSAVQPCHTNLTGLMGHNHPNNTNDSFPNFRLNNYPNNESVMGTPCRNPNAWPYGGEMLKGQLPFNQSPEFIPMDSFDRYCSDPSRYGRSLEMADYNFASTMLKVLNGCIGSPLPGATSVKSFPITDLTYLNTTLGKVSLAVNKYLQTQAEGLYKAYEYLCNKIGIADNEESYHEVVPKLECGTMAACVKSSIPDGIGLEAAIRQGSEISYYFETNLVLVLVCTNGEFTLKWNLALLGKHEIEGSSYFEITEDFSKMGYIIGAGHTLTSKMLEFVLRRHYASMNLPFNN